MHAALQLACQAPRRPACAGASRCLLSAVSPRCLLLHAGCCRHCCWSVRLCAACVHVRVCARVCRLQQAVARASKKIQQGSDKMALASSLKMVSAGVEMVFGSAAAISAAFGYTDRVGLDVELLEQTQQSILQLFSAEE